MVVSFIITLPMIAAIISILKKKDVQVLNIVSVVSVFLELVASLILLFSVAANGDYVFTRYFAVDSFGSILLVIVALIGFTASWYSTSYLQVEVSKKIIGFENIWSYFVFLHLFLLAMFFAIITTSPIFMWISIEATTLSTAFLISFYNKPSAVEAAWKYLIINSVGLLLGFFGTLLFISSITKTGGHTLVYWQSLLTNAPNFDPMVAKIAFIFVLVGYGTKIGLAPMHTWLPDAHSKAPVPVSSLLSGVLLNIAFYAVLRFKSVTDASIGPSFSQQLLIFFGILSIVIAALIMYVQKNYKRLLAYSSIEHMGVIALGFGFGGAGALAAILHIIYHSLAKSILFLSAGNIFLKYSTTKINKIRGVLSVLPISGTFFLIGFLAITGVPPFGIFLTEFIILSSGIQNHLGVTIVALMALALVFVGFLRHVSSMFFGKADENIIHGEMGNRIIAPIVLLVILLTVASVYIPTAIQLLVQSASQLY